MKCHRLAIAAHLYALAALLWIFSVGAAAQPRQPVGRPGRADQRPQTVGQMKLGKFVGRSPASPTNDTVESGDAGHLNAAELKQVLATSAPVIPYAELSVRFPSVANRAHLEFGLYGTRNDNRLSVNYGDGGEARFIHAADGRVVLAVQPRAIGKTYIADCVVRLIDTMGAKGSGDFTVLNGLGSQKMVWQGEKKWQHLVLAIVPEDKYSYYVTISNDGPGWAFRGCRVMEY